MRKQSSKEIIIDLLLDKQKYTKSIINLDSVKNISEKLKLKFVRQNPYYIALLHNPSEYLQMVAINIYAEIIWYIDKPTEKVIEYVFKMRPDLVSTRNLMQQSEEFLNKLYNEKILKEVL